MIFFSQIINPSIKLHWWSGGLLPPPPPRSVKNIINYKLKYVSPIIINNVRYGVAELLVVTA